MEQNNKSLATSNEELKLAQLDLATMLKASLAISEQLLPEKLSETLLQAVMNESGADKGYLLLEHENQISIAAEAALKEDRSIEIQVFDVLKIPDYNFLPENIIKHVRSTSDKVIINDVSKDTVFSSDKYISTVHPKSIACIPIIKDEKNIGTIYLENSHFTNVFTPEKIVVLKILTTQASVSFENMNLFNNLNLSKKRFQDIMDNTPTIIFAKYLDGRYLFINKEFENIYKVERQKVINLTDFDIFPKEFAQSFVAKDKVIIDTGKPLTFEEKIPHGNDMHTYIVAKFPLFDSSGKFYAIGGISTDISDLKRMQESLRENQNRFNFVLAATQDSIYDWDLVSGRIWRNEQYEKLYNGPAGPNLAWWKNNIHPDEYADVVTRLEAAFGKHEQLWHQEYRFKRATQGYSYIIDRGFIVYDNLGKPVRMIGALMDITERKQFIDDLERSLALSKATLESTTDGILVVNADNKIADYNKKFIEMWKIPESIFESNDDKQLIAFMLGQLKDSHNFVAKIDELNKSPESESFDLIKFKDGKTFERYSKPQKTKTNIIGRVWSFRDITERVKTEEDEKKRAIKIIERQSELLRLNNLMLNIPIKEKLKKIVESDAKTMEVERVSIQFIDADWNTITSENTYILSKGDYEAGISIMRKDYPRYFSELEFNKIIDANNAENDPRTSELKEKYLKYYGITSLLSVPFKLKGKIVGIICHEHVGRRRNWSYEEMVFANSIADIISLILETNEREKTENELKKLNELLEERVKDRTSELSANEQKFRAVVETANDSIISFDKEWKIIYWNKAAEKMFGYTSQEVIGQPITILMPQYYIENLKKSFDHYLKTKEATIIGKGIVELNGLRKSGIEFPLELSIDAWKSNNEDFFTGIIRDISERKKTEEELIKKNKEIKHANIFLDSILENIPYIIFVKEVKELRYIRINKAAEEFMGYKKEELIGKNDYDIFPKEQADLYIANDRKLLNKEGVLDVPEEPVNTKNGKRWLHTKIIIIKDEFNVPLYLVGISTDITAKKEVEHSDLIKKEESKSTS